LFDLKRFSPPVALGQEGWSSATLHASYVHLHWGGCPTALQQWLQTIQQAKQKRRAAARQESKQAKF
jgi:cobyrinic acid a,c-diamide synthase